MGELREGAALYLRIIAARIRAQLQYRASFALETVGMFFVTFLDFVVILVIFANVPALAGWSRAEVALLYGISPRDPMVFASIPLLLIGIALAACLVPSWRASRMDPLVALRCD